MLPGLVAAVAVGGLGAGSGGYFAPSWGWSAVGLAWVAGLALLLRRSIRLTPLELGFAGGLLALAAWTGLSTAWSTDLPQSVLETQRTLVYVTGVAAVLLLVRRRELASLPAGLLVGIVLVCAYGLATRLAPDHFGGFNTSSIEAYRLARPVTYWNALGIFTAIGIVLALGFATRARSIAARAAAAASLVVLAPTIYFTFGRGAWIALAVGLVVVVALEQDRLRLLVVGGALSVLPAVAVLAGSSRHGLTDVSATLADATHDGHRLAVLLLMLLLVQAVTAVALGLAERRVVVQPYVRRAAATTIASALLVALIAVFVRFGDPVTLVRKGYDSFTAPPVNVTSGQSLGNRLLSLSSNGRVTLWDSAWRDFTAHPLGGSGAGSFENWWNRDRATNLKVRDAHSLYAETLAELGIVGLLLLVGALALPLVAAVQARRHPFTAPLAGAYVAFLLHTGADWDWEMTAITLAGLLCGAGLLVAARGERRTPLELGRPGRIACGAAVVAVGTFAFVGLLGNTPIRAATKSVRDQNWSNAARQAHKAMGWAPWSGEPWLRLGQSQVATGNVRAGVANIREALRRDPNNWDYWFSLALATTGEPQQQALRRALALNPRSPEIAEFLAGTGIKVK